MQESGIEEVVADRLSEGRSGGSRPAGHQLPLSPKQGRRAKRRKHFSPSCPHSQNDNHLRTSPASRPLRIHASASTLLQQSSLDLSTDHGEHEPQRHARGGQNSQMLTLNLCPDNKLQFIHLSSSLSCFSSFTVQPAVSHIHQI